MEVLQQPKSKGWNGSFEMWAWKVYIAAFIWFMLDFFFFSYLVSENRLIRASCIVRRIPHRAAKQEANFCDKHDDEWCLISYQAASDFGFYLLQTHMGCFSSIQKILASSVSSYCFCNKISHIIATADHLPFHSLTHTHIHTYFMWVGVVSRSGSAGP